MDPVFVVFWMTIALLGGFLLTYAHRSWDVDMSAAILTSFVAIGLTCGGLMGNPWAPAFIALALASGLFWGILDPYVRERAEFARLMAWQRSFPAGNHAGSRPPHREAWGERLARWGFPSTEQMCQERLYQRLRQEFADRSSGRGAIELSSRYVDSCPRGFHVSTM